MLPGYTGEETKKMQDGSYSRRAAAERSACGEALFDHGLVAVWHRLAIFHLRIAVSTAGASRSRSPAFGRLGVDLAGPCNSGLRCHHRVGLLNQIGDLGPREGVQALQRHPSVATDIRSRNNVLLLDQFGERFRSAL